MSTCGLSVYCWFRCPQFTSFPGHPAYFLRLFHSSRSSDSEVESLIGGIFHKPVAAKPAPREHLTLEQDQRCQVKYAANSYLSDPFLYFCLYTETKKTYLIKKHFLKLFILHSVRVNGSLRLSTFRELPHNVADYWGF